MPRKYQNLLILGLLFFHFGLDQVSKRVAQQNIEYHEKIPIMGNFFYLTKVENTGAMLSFGSNLPEFWRMLLLTYAPVAVLLAGLLYILVMKLPSLWEILGYSSILGGGIGNLLDRLKFGSVTDFMNMGIGPLRTGIFNMADVSIMVGLGLLVLKTLLIKKAPKRSSPSTSF